MRRAWDTLIVGGGTAGCILARRLSHDPDRRVLVLEAARRDRPWDLAVHMPAALSMPIGNPRYDWRFESEPEPRLHGRRIYHARGKVLGGSSSINGMIFQRGNPLDYERWGGAPGMVAWDYAHCLPYFKRMETCLAGADDWRGGSGPQVLERGPCRSPLFAAFLDAVVEAGYERTDDVNGFRQEGFAAFDRTLHRGRRLSAARAWLHPVLGRPNLRVRTGVQVTAVRFDGTRAVGVEVARRGGIERIDAGEVILAGGAFHSPQLLQLSGVGPADLLRSHDIDVVADLPGVGANLQDHLEVYVQHACRQPVSHNPDLKRWRWPWIGLRWLLARSGPAATNHFEAGGFVRGNDTVEWPNLMFHFLPLAVRYDGTQPGAAHGYQVHVGPMFADARGDVRIRSRDPRQHPALRFNYLSSERDRREWVEAIAVARHILGQPALAGFDGGELSPGPQVRSDAQILDWVGRDAETALHPCGTCRLGTDADAVVDPATMAVHGVDGLRVVDASVFPTIPNGNICAPVMMVAEKAADLIAGATPLAPDVVDWHRHR